MASIWVTHNLYPDNPHVFIVDFRKVVKIMGEPRTGFYKNRRGEEFWEIVIYTSGLGSEGESLGPYWLDVYDSEQTLDELINNKIKDIIDNYIDWSKSSIIDEDLEAQIDRYPPIIYWSYPTAGAVNVPINSTVSVRIKDLPPAKGIDISTLVFKVDGFEVTPEISGNKYDYSLNYRPKVSL